MQCNNPGRYVSNITRIANAVRIKLFIDGFVEIDGFFLINCHNSHKGSQISKSRLKDYTPWWPWFCFVQMMMIWFWVCAWCWQRARGGRGNGGASQPQTNFFNRTMMMSWHKVQTSQHRQNIKRYNFFHYFGFYHKVGEVGIINYYISVTSVTSVKSSLGIITHQGHISQIG